VDILAQRPQQSAAPRSDSRQEYDNLQKRYDGFVQKRNELNDLARQLRQERDLLNEGHRTFRSRMDEAAKKRDAINVEMKEAKKRRNEFQAQAKALIGQRKGKSGDVAKSLPLQVRQLEKQVRDLSHKQETQPHTIEAERDLLKLIKQKQDELTELKSKLEAHRELKVDLSDMDSAIDELFRRADEEHEKVKALNKESSKWHDEFVKAAEEGRVVQREGNEKHQEFIAVRQKADEQHKKAMELKEKMIELRQGQRQEREAHRRELREYNESVKREVADPKKIEAHADDALEALKKGGKISL
jgi:phosphoserine phosphatase